MTSGALSPVIGTVQGRVQGVNRQDGGVELAGRNAVQCLGDVVAGQGTGLGDRLPIYELGGGAAGGYRGAAPERLEAGLRDYPVFHSKVERHGVAADCILLRTDTLRTLNDPHVAGVVEVVEECLAVPRHGKFVAAWPATRSPRPFLAARLWPAALQAPCRYHRPRCSFPR